MQGRDLLIYFAFCALPIGSFLLMGYPDTQFYLSLMLVSLLVIVWMEKRVGPDQLLTYDADLSGQSLLWIFAGVAGTVVSASVLVQGFTASSLYVPMAQVELSVGSLVLPKLASDILFQLTLVAPSEEASKLVTHLSMFNWLKEKTGKGVAQFISIVLPIGVWSMLHAYRAYTGPNMNVLMLAAFGAGFVIYATMYKTKSFLAAILVHATYNALVIYILSGGVV